MLSVTTHVANHKRTASHDADIKRDVPEPGFIIIIAKGQVKFEHINGWLISTCVWQKPDGQKSKAQSWGVVRDWYER